MSSTETEKHCRLCLMLSKGGTKACYHLLFKRVEELSPVNHQPYPWTVQQFLESKKDAIKKSKLSKEKFDVLFPRHGATELTKWDLSLFCKVLTLYCDLKLLIRQDIEQLLRMRNDLCHMNEPSLTDVQFKDYLETIQVTLSRIMQDIKNQMVKSEIDKDMDQLENGPLALNETLREMRTFYLMEFDINKKLEHVIDVNETVLKKIDKLDDRLELIYSRPDLKDSSTLVAARNNFLLPGLDIFLDLNNVSEDEEIKMSIVLEQLFEEVINGDNDFRCSIPAESYVRLRGAVKRTFQLFLSKGWRITHTKHACIQLHIRCTNFRSLAALFRELIHGHIDHQLTYLNEALNECFNGRDLRLETTIYKDEFWNVIDKSISSVEGFLTRHNIDSVNPNDNKDIIPDESRHTLSLSAENVRPESSESPGAIGNNELETCLQLLKTELKSEFYAPHLSIIANCSSIVDHESYNLCSDDKVEIPGEEENMQTIRISEHQSSKVNKDEKESTKILKDEKGEYVERIIKGLILKEIEPTTGTRVKQKEHSGEEKEITGQAKMDVSPAIPMATSATDSKEASSDDQVYGTAGGRYKSQFETESLYQFYHEAKITRASKRTDIYSSFDESDEEGFYDDYGDTESVHKNLSGYSSGRGSLDMEKKPEEDAKTKKISTLKMFGKKVTVLRSLWAEMPEVRESGWLDKITPHEKMLQESMFEIITSEAAYLKSLNVLINVFLMSDELGSDMSNKCVITKQERHVIFSNIGAIRDTSERFLSALESRWKESVLLTDVCDIITEHTTKYFECYVHYCSNQAFQDRAVTDLRKKPEFSEGLKRLESNPDCQGLPMISFLLLPMQRIIRLQLLVDALCYRANPFKDNQIYQSAINAFNAQSKIVRKCSDGAKKMKKTEQMYHIAKQIDFPANKEIPQIPLISASRYLVKQGEVTKIVNDQASHLPFGKAKAGKQTLHIYLFNDIMLITKKQGERYVVTDYGKRRTLDIELIDNPEKNARVLPLGVPSGCKYLFLLVMLENHENKQVETVFACNSTSDRARWVDAVTHIQRHYDECDWPQEQCIKPYIAKEPDELTLDESDVVYVFKKLEDGMYRGERLRDGGRGWFPKDHTVEFVNSHLRARNLRMRYRLMASQIYGSQHLS